MMLLRVDSMSSRITFMCYLSCSHAPVLKLSESESSSACRVNNLTRFSRSWGGSEVRLIDSRSV